MKRMHLPSFVLLILIVTLMVGCWQPDTLTVPTQQPEVSGSGNFNEFPVDTEPGSDTAPPPPNDELLPLATPTARPTPTAIQPRVSANLGPNTIKIISSLPRTGLAKFQTDSIINAFMMALNERSNMAGGFQIVYEDWDDATAQRGMWDEETERQNAIDAVNDPDIMVYVGTFNSGAAKISIPILNDAGLAMISPSNNWPALTKSGWEDTAPASYYDISKPRNYFRVVTADDVQAQVAASWALELGFKNAYILNDQEDYGKGVANVFEQHFKALGGNVIINEGIDQTQPEFRALMQKVRDSGADLVYFGGLIDTGGPQLVKDLRAVDRNIAFMGPDGIKSNQFISASGSGAAEGTLVAHAGRELTDYGERGMAFQESYKATYNDDMDPYAIYGYEVMNVALDAIERAGRKDRAAILKAMSETKNYEGVLGVWSFDENGDTTLSDVACYKVVNGEFELQKYMNLEGNIP